MESIPDLDICISTLKEALNYSSKGNENREAGTSNVTKIRSSGHTAGTVGHDDESISDDRINQGRVDKDCSMSGYINGLHLVNGHDNSNRTCVESREKVFALSCKKEVISEELRVVGKCGYESAILQKDEVSRHLEYEKEFRLDNVMVLTVTENRQVRPKKGNLEINTKNSLTNGSMTNGNVLPNGIDSGEATNSCVNSSETMKKVNGQTVNAENDNNLLQPKYTNGHLRNRNTVKNKSKIKSSNINDSSKKSLETHQNSISQNSLNHLEGTQLGAKEDTLIKDRGRGTLMLEILILII